ncbi:hypothetical protein HQ533_00795 [Candidatus Woesearchaeota archaeon]|nr:hypothetical protein [Candidatus Woesearchaeota archaeon]
MQDMHKMDFGFEWGEPVPLCLQDIFLYSFVEDNDFPWNDVSNSISFVTKHHSSGGYIEENELRSRGRKIGRFFLDKKNIPWLLENYDKIMAELNVYLNKIEKIDFSEMTKVEIKKHYKEFIGLRNKTLSWYRGTRHEAEYFIEKIIRDEIAKHYENVDEVFSIITASPYPDPIGEEQADWLKLLEKEATKEDFQKHIRKYSMFYTNIFSKEELYATIKERYEKNKLKIAKIKREKQESEKKRKKLAEKQKEILSKINSKDVEDYLVIFHRFGEYRFRLKPGYAGIEALSLDMLTRVADLANMSLHDFFDLMTVKESLEFLKTGALPDNKVLEDRKIARVHLIRDKKQYTLQGQEAIDFLNKTIFKIDTNITEFKGTPACPGKVVGKVKLVLSNTMEEVNKALEEFEEGQILVTHNTQPNMVPLMTKAAAIVTAQGGITSHSAVVAREFQIPCVVGIESVTMFLKEGDMIEVDAEKGLVKKL